MRTLIEGGWVVAFNGTSHEVYEQGSVVFEDDRIVHAGGAYTGTADTRLSARGKLVSPGFINTHVHTGRQRRATTCCSTWPRTTTAPRTT